MRFSLNGKIVSNDDEWLYQLFGFECCCPRNVRQALEAVPAGEAFELEINSPGGSVFAGFEIYSMLRSAKCKTIAEVQSLAGSAASTAMVGCGTVKVSPVAQVMIHLPSAVTHGDVHAHQQTERILKSITESILNGYESKVSGKTSRDELRSLMERETWLTADRAIELGLADEILDSAVSGQTQFRNAVDILSSGSRDPAKMLQMYENLVRSGMCKEIPGHPVAPLKNSDPTGEEPDNHTEDSSYAEMARALLAEY